MIIELVASEEICTRKDYLLKGLRLSGLRCCLMKYLFQIAGPLSFFIYSGSNFMFETTSFKYLAAQK